VERARIRTAVARDMFIAEYDRPPADARELSGFLARASRQATTAVAGYDLTFSPVKSVSALWALAAIDIAAVIEQAHHDAVADTLAWLEQRAIYTRTGHRSAQQIDVHGLIAAAFTHRDSRAGDPDLHTHVAISNKVQALDGRWLALDGRPLYKFTVSASERYNTRLEALLVARLGVAFAERSGVQAGKRPVREIVGIDGQLLARWSARRQMIDLRRGELAVEFQHRHGRPPTTVEALALAQQATLETRQGKHEPRSWGEQRTGWRAEAVTILGGPQRLAAMVSECIPQTRAAAKQALAMTSDWVATTADEVLGTVQKDRASWQEAHIRAEAERVARGRGVALADVDSTVEALVGAALGPSRSITLGTSDPVDEPAELRRRDGTSVYATVGTQLYTSAQVLKAEQELVAAARRRGGRQVSESAVDVALLESVANGVTLNPGQVQLVRELATSGARLQLALAPAGTGKTTAMRVLAHAWASDDAQQPGQRRGTVVGLAPAAAAASVLRGELADDDDTPARRRVRPRARDTGPHTDTLAKLLDATGDFYQRTGWLPGWIRDIGPRTLVVIDEAGMAGTLELARAVDFVLARGASVRLVGDDQQLAAVGAGGVLRDIAQQVGVVALSQVVRFTHPDTGRAEAAASLALRAGDPAAIGFYLDHGRVHVGDLATATEHAYQGWLRDRAAGRDAVMLAPTREIVVELNRRARAERIATTAATVSADAAADIGRRRVAQTAAASHGALIDRPAVSRHDLETRAERTGREVGLVDGTQAGAGDIVITRRNQRDLPITRTEWVKNGDRFRVADVRRDGSLRVTHLSTGRKITLPSSYVAGQVTLGYATTVHTAQGITADAAHLVATGEEARQIFYVGITRGRLENHVYLATASDGDPHTVITRDALLPPTSADVLTRILERDGAAVSAATAQRELTNPARRLGDLAARYHDALLVGALTVLGPEQAAHLDNTADQKLPGLTASAAYPTLRGALALLSLGGVDPATALRNALAQREISTAADPAAVLTWRLNLAPITTTPDVPGTSRRPDLPQSDPESDVGAAPLPWLPPLPATLAADQRWGAYLAGLADRVRETASAVATAARNWTPSTAPTWAAGLAASERPDSLQLVTDLAVWRAATGVETTDLEPAGPPQHLLAEQRHQRQLRERVHHILGDPRALTTRWQPLAQRVEPRVLADPYWPQLAARFDAAYRAGIDIAQLAIQVGSERSLPDEQPAAALWWRIAGHLAPGVLPADLTTAVGSTTRLRPAWAPVLDELFGQQTAQRVMADPAWPALVAAVADAAAGGWRPDELLDAAHSLAAPATIATAATAAGQRLRADELATALVWRIGTLTDPPPADGDLDAPPDDRFDHGPSEADLAEAAAFPPADLYRLPTTDEPGSPLDPDREVTSSIDRDQRTGTDPERRQGPSLVDKLETVLAFDRRQPPPHDWADRYVEEHHWATAAVPRDRLVELNSQAMDYYTARYPHSWVPGYLRSRLGTDLRDHPAYKVGYAPPGWTHLIDHLRRRGASDDELLAAGLANRAASGRLYDVFRDRLLLPVKQADTGEIVAFIARRNPALDPAPGSDLGGSATWVETPVNAERVAGPKYLNTRTTDLFVKGQHVYGLAEAREHLAAGATVVRVEGPIDAIAVSLAGRCDLVGAAPLGTSLTPVQARLLVDQPGQRPVIVATDPDPAGQSAAAIDFWRLTAAGDTPRHALLPNGLDPADALTSSGSVGLNSPLRDAVPLARTQVEQRMAFYADRLDTPEGRLHAARSIAQVLGALPPQQWMSEIERVSERLPVAMASLQVETVNAAYTWVTDPTAVASRLTDDQHRMKREDDRSRLTPSAAHDTATLGYADGGESAEVALIATSAIAPPAAAVRPSPRRSAQPPASRTPRR
jgi:conjugative relaxase-like TrwC/TraI family protein